MNQQEEQLLAKNSPNMAFICLNSSSKTKPKKKTKKLSTMKSLFNKNRKLISMKFKILKKRRHAVEEGEDEEEVEDVLNENNKKKFSLKKFFGFKKNQNQNSLLNRSFIIIDSSSIGQQDEEAKTKKERNIKNLVFFKDNQLFEMRIYDELRMKQDFECKFFMKHHHHCHCSHHNHANKNENLKLVNLLNNAFYESTSILL